MEEGGAEHEDSVEENSNPSSKPARDFTSHIPDISLPKADGEMKSERKSKEIDFSLSGIFLPQGLQIGSDFHIVISFIRGKTCKQS